jgi:UDP-glucose 4-epimerase
VIIARFFNTVGLRQVDKYGMVPPTFVKQALSGQPITVYGHGKQSRSFTYVWDCVKTIMALMENEKAIGQVFNIGIDKEITIGDLARKVKEMANSSSEIVFIHYDDAYESGF